MDVAALIQALGGAAAVAHELRQKRTTVAMWGSRNAVPAEQLVTLWRMAREKCIDWSPPGAEGLDLVRREQPPEAA
jgi:hypothetical protein